MSNPITKKVVKMVLQNFSEKEKISRMILGTSSVEPIVILPATDSMAHRIGKLFKNKKNRGKTIQITIDDKKVTLCHTGIGAPAVEIIVNALCAAGAKTVIRFDVCGGLIPMMNVGDIFLAKDAYGYDAVSRLYNDGSPDISAASHLHADFVALLEQKKEVKAKWSTGTIATVDFFFAQTKEHHQTWSQYAQAIDMETAALYAICLRNDVHALSVMAISDVLLANQNPFLNNDYDYLAFRSGMKNLLSLIPLFIERISH